MLTLVSALLVAGFNRKWLSGPVRSLIPPGGPSSERISRIRARIQADMEELVEKATRRGRPPRPSESSDETLVLRELLALVPPNAWADLSGSDRARVVEAQERLKQKHGLSARDFCKYLGIPGRTFRYWKKKHSASLPSRSPSEPVSQKTGPRKKKRNLGRFDLAITAPGLQSMADTSQWEIFGIPMKIVAAQDPGNRKKKLWESFEVTSREDSQTVIKVISEALKENPGAQVLTDQGTPYMAQATEEALEELELDHVPQKEGAPTEKAPKERAFGIVKQALKPLSDLTNRLSEKLPALRNPELAQSLGRILLAVYLRVYCAAAHNTTHPLEGKDPEVVRAVVEEQRAKARAELRSKRLFLTEMHRAYNFRVPLKKFLRAHRRFHLEDIKEAERRLRIQLAKKAVHAPYFYFVAVLRNLAEEMSRKRAKKRARLLALAREQEQWEKDREELTRREKQAQFQPELHLTEGLDFVRRNWIPRDRILLARGRGYGTRFIREGLTTMKKQDPYTLQDRAQAVWTAWSKEMKNEDPEKIRQVHQVFEELLREFLPSPPSTPELVACRMGLRPKTRNRPPNGQSGLRNYAARSGG